MSYQRSRLLLAGPLAFIASGALLLAGCDTTPAPAQTPTATTPAATSSATGSTSTPGTPAATATGASSTTRAPGGAATPAPAVSSTPVPVEPVTSTASIATNALPKARFISGTKTVTLPIEVPPEREYNIGLSGRRSLEGRGMLFSFPEGGTTGFWMKNTHIDLDIAFIDASMRVSHITTMTADTEVIHRPPTPYIAAVEAPVGWYAANGVITGMSAEFDVDLRAATGR